MQEMQNQIPKTEAQNREINEKVKKYHSIAIPIWIAREKGTHDVEKILENDETTKTVFLISEIKIQTRKAICVIVENQEIWLPKSQIMIFDDAIHAWVKFEV